MHRRLPSEELTNLGGLTFGDFWSWAYSDILGNINRAAFAEFLVAAALNLLDTPGVEWDGVDLRYQGHGIEVKASAYVQSWPQAAPSRICFDIGKKRSWDPVSNTYAPQPIRSAGCYVFCLFPATNVESARRCITDADAWVFYVVATQRLEEEFGDQESIGLKAIEKMSPVVPYRNLHRQIELVLGIQE